MKRGDDVEVLEGLSEGDRIVVSGQFLIDSESSLQASFQRMAPDTTSAMTGVKAN
jgi:Cu(I)/Ag(I) efflux system membrane fusion protein